MKTTVNKNERLTHQRQLLASKTKEIRELRKDLDEYHRILMRAGQLLRQTARGLKGRPPPLTFWGHHDLPEIAARYRKALPREKRWKSDPKLG